MTWLGLLGSLVECSGADVPVLAADRREPLVVLPLRLAAEIADAKERSRQAGSREAFPRCRGIP